jgi:hypothetical protein
MKLSSGLATLTGTAATLVSGTAAVTLLVASAVAGAYLLAGAYSGSSDAVGQIGSSDHVNGAPGPVAGAGLPGIIVVGAYWLVRRQRRKSDTGLPRGDLKD